MEAIDKNLYGWFWTCPNGEKCIYRHALPPGFVLKRKETAKVEQDDISLEELIEKEVISLTLILIGILMYIYIFYFHVTILDDCIQKPDGFLISRVRTLQTFFKSKIIVCGLHYG